VKSAATFTPRSVENARRSMHELISHNIATSIFGR
jgi:hypothetical protein